MNQAGNFSLPLCQSLPGAFTALQVAKQEGSVAATGSLFTMQPQLAQVCPAAFKVAKMKKDASFVTTIQTRKCSRVDKQQTILDLLERHIQFTQVIGTARNSAGID